MNYLTLFLTERCQKDCFYCDIGRMPARRKTDEPLLNKFLPYIAQSDWQNIVLTGGEPALVGETVFSKVLDELKFKHVRVNTNGWLLYHGFFERYYDLINEVQFHPVSEISFNFDVFSDEKIIYNFPIHKRNIKYLRKFLDTYHNIPIMLTPYDDKIGDPTLSLDTKDCADVYEIIKNRENIKKETITLFRILSNILDPDFIRNFCSNKIVAYPSIDFVNGRIKKCIKSHTRSDWKPLTIKNFQNLRNLHFEHNEICNNCMLFVKDFEFILRKMI